MTQIRDVRRVHMIGVGGSSMSGLAGLLKDEGYEVSGSDRTRSHKTEALEAHGVKVLIMSLVSSLVRIYIPSF